MKLKEQFAIRYIRAKFKILSSISKKKAAERAFELFCTPQKRNTKPLPPVFKEAEKIQFLFQDFTITGYRWNKGGSHKALVIHGFESSVINFDHFISALIEKGYEVLAFDAPAHGRSSGKRLTAVIYCDLIRYIHSNYGPVQTFIAHSFGGLAVSMCLAEISHDSNCRLVLIAPATETRTAIDQLLKLLNIDDATVRQEFENIITRISGHQVSWFSIPRALKKIKATILWVHDVDDTTTPLADADNIRNRKYSNIRFVITKGLGHRRIYRDAEIVRQIIEFI